jgi:hypothetical protein
LSHILLNYNECAEEDHCSYHNSAAEMIPCVLLEMLILGSIGIGMGQQFMNSLLYMSQYFLQCNDPDSPNFNQPDFPLG